MINVLSVPTQMLNLVSGLFLSALSLRSVIPRTPCLVGSGIAAHLTTQLTRCRAHPSRAPFYDMSRPISCAIPMLLPIEHRLAAKDIPVPAGPMNNPSSIQMPLRTMAMRLSELQVPLLKHVANIPIQPHALQLGGIHVTGAGNVPLARGRAAEAVEGLRHGPFGAGVEEC
jgi:hypothetical protein